MEFNISSSPQMSEPQFIYWKKSIKKHVDKLISTSRTLTYNDRLAELDKLMPFISKESFIYKSLSDRLKGCDSLIKCAQYLLATVDGASYKDRKTFFNGILCILHRREFDVQSFDIKLGNGGMSITCCNSILDIMTRYRTLLYQVQAYSNSKLCSKGIYTTLLSFCFSVTAINYCYIGRITSMVLNCLAPDEGKEETPEDPVIKQLNEMLEEHTAQAKPIEEESRSVQVFCHLKWALGEIPKSTEFKKLESIVNQNTSWLAIFKKDDVNRYRFIAELVNYAVYMTRNHTEWSFLLGYFDLIHPFLRDMKSEAPNYSKNTVALSKTLLYNMRLLNIYMKITLESTSLHNTGATLNSIQRLSEWFSCCKNKHNLLHLPNYIDFKLIRSAFSILLLENEHYNTLLSSLIFLYNHLSSFPPNERDLVISELFLNNFFRFFLHWNSDVRTVFHHIVVFKVFAFEVLGGSMDSVMIVGREPIMMRSLVVDMNHFEAVKEKIKIIKRLMESPSKASLDERYRQLLPYATPSLNGYCETLQAYNEWKAQVSVGSDGNIIYPIIKCSTMPEG